MKIQKNNPKVLRGWVFYDWANSVYSLAITSAIFPVYYNSATRAAYSGDIVPFLGYSVSNTVIYSYSLSFSFLVVAFLSPVLSGVADSGGVKKTMMQIFTWLGSISCVLLFFFEGQNVEFGIICAFLASVGFSGSLVFYNAYLPDIATPDQFDRLSARGFSMGYIGSVIQLIFCLVLVLEPGLFGLAGSAQASRISFLFVGVWWIGFAQITFSVLPNNVHQVKRPRSEVLVSGFKELKKVWAALKLAPETRKYLLSFFFYNMGVQTVMYLAALFGEKELKLETGQLIGTIMIIQLVAIAGAYSFARLSEKKGNKQSLLVMICIWVFICLAAYFVETAVQFYVLAVVVGTVMGGIQSLSRSTYSKLIPQNSIDTASYFSFYDVTEKLSIVLGTFAYGLVEQLTGSMRSSSLALMVFFLIGLLLLSRFKLQPSHC